MTDSKEIQPQKFLLCCIIKDDSEYEMAKRMLDSFMQYCTGLAVAITGISGKHGKIKRLVEEKKGRWIVTTPQTHPQLYMKREDGSWIFASFAEARNVSLDLASQMQEKEAYDWWMWADTDDVIHNGWELQQVGAMAKQLNLDYIFFTYWYSVQLTPDGQIANINIEHMRERLLKPNVFKFISRLHEVAVAKDPNYSLKHSVYDFNPQENRQLAWIHLPGKEERLLANMERNREILEAQVREEERKDPRTLFSLAKVYFDMNTPKTDVFAIELIKEELPMNGWAEDRSFGWEYMGNLYARRGDHKNAIFAYHEAIKDFGNRPMLFLLLAKEYQEVGMQDQAEFYLETAMRMDPPKARTTISNPLETKVMAASLKYNDAIKKTNIPEAIKWLKTRNELLQITNDGMLTILEEARELNDAGMWVFNYCQWLRKHGHVQNIRHVVESFPIEIGREPMAFHIANEINEPRIWGEKEIAYYANFGGEHFEQFGAGNTETGVGGSETAVIKLSKEWAKMGYKVTVYCDPRDSEGEYEGVKFVPWYQMNWKDEFNILILWRSPHLLDQEIKAKKLFMDLHDIASQLDWTPERMKKVDRVFFKSQWHRKNLPKLSDEKAVVISNGINL